MNIQWSNMTGFGPAAWNQGGQPLKIPSMAQQHKENEELVYHPHEKLADHSIFRNVRKTSHHDG